MKDVSHHARNQKTAFTRKNLSALPAALSLAKKMGA
jgi:hypothetical protein